MAAGLYLREHWTSAVRCSHLAHHRRFSRSLPEQSAIPATVPSGGPADTLSMKGTIIVAVVLLAAIFGGIFAVANLH